MTAARKPAPVVDTGHCPRNDDCQAQQAEALARLAAHADRLFGHPDDDAPTPFMRTMTDLGEIAGKWLSFCLFMRKWFPKVGWWAVPLVWTLIFNGGGELSNALISALTAYLQMQTGG